MEVSENVGATSHPKLFHFSIEIILVFSIVRTPHRRMFLVQGMIF
jgi:hypothetical protein